jgi:putative ABC transport system permease protein
MRHLAVIIRQVRRSSSQAVLFVLCVALSLAALTAFSGFAQSVDRSLRLDARKLQGADIIIKSYDPLAAPLERTVERLVDAGQVERLRIHEFFSVVRAADESKSLLADLKVVEPGYPFYGKVGLASGRPLRQVLVPGSCIVEQSLLDRLGLKRGDRLKVGYTTLTIADVVVSEPDRPINFFSFGPRVFAAAGDLNAMGLVGEGSRIRRVLLLKVNDADRLDALAARLKQAAQPDQEQVDTYLTAGSRVTRFLNNFFFFLKLVGLFILLLAGIGIQGTLGAMLKEKQRTIAIMKAIGAANGYLLRHFAAIIGVLGALGTGLGILGGLLLQKVLARSLSAYLPVGLAPSISWSGVSQGLALGFGVVALFSFVPLRRISELRPMTIFRLPGDPVSPKGADYFFGGLLVLFFAGLVFWNMHDFYFGLYFVGGLLGLIIVAALPTQTMLWAVRRRPVHGLMMRQAAKGLFRPGNATRSIMITLTASLAVIFANYLIGKNLDASFVQSYPKEAPNAFFVDIQPDQAAAFAGLVGGHVVLYPIVRARVTAVNGQAIDRVKERRKRRDNLSRIFNLTYRARLLEDETIIQGRSLFRKDWSGHQVSVMDTVAQMHSMQVGDTVSFRIQGVPLKARISSIRTHTRSSFSPFFYFVFPAADLQAAPHTFFAALKVLPKRLGALQSRVVARFPNISMIDMTQTIGVFIRLMNRLSGIIRAFSLFSIAAGLLILVSSIYATRAERVIESVYYKILGAGKSFVLRVFALENMIIGLFSGALAMIMGQAAAFWVCRIKLDIDYHAFLLSSSLLIGATVALIMAVGLTASRSILEKRPAVYLREQADG